MAQPSAEPLKPVLEGIYDPSSKPHCSALSLHLSVGLSVFTSPVPNLVFIFVVDCTL